MWGTWQYLSCTQSCGGGNLRSERFCNDPPPEIGGQECQLSSGEERGLVETVTFLCNLQPCGGGTGNYFMMVITSLFVLTSKFKGIMICDVYFASFGCCFQRFMSFSLSL